MAAGGVIALASRKVLRSIRRSRQVVLAAGVCALLLFLSGESYSHVARIFGEATLGIIGLLWLYAAGAFACKLWHNNLSHRVWYKLHGRNYDPNTPIMPGQGHDHAKWCREHGYPVPSRSEDNGQQASSSPQQGSPPQPG